MILSTHNLSKSFGDTLILDEIDITVNSGDRIGLVGANGAGKTTLLNIICKKLTADSGDVDSKSNLTIGYLKQNSLSSLNGTIWSEMLSAFSKLLEIQENLRLIEDSMSNLENHNSTEYKDLEKQYAEQSAFFEANDGYNIEFKIKSVLNGMGFSDRSHNTDTSTLSGGEKTRLQLAKLLLEQPNLLILDEPTNHLDFKTLTWLEDYLSDYNGAILVVSHDRYFLDKMVRIIWELDRSNLSVYSGNYSKYKLLRHEKLTRQQKEYDFQQRQIGSMLDYAQRNIARASTSASARGRLKKVENMELIEKPLGELKTPKFSFTFDKQSVNDVLSVSELTLRVGEEQKTLVKDINFEVKRGERIAIIGANGTGKSTLLKAILGKISAIGDIKWGKNVAIGSFEQEAQNLDPHNTVLNELWNRFPRIPVVEIRGLLGRMLLTDDSIDKQVGVISGGERAKLSFAIMIAENGNTLLLDEPTNHIDLPSKDAIEEALLKFEGTLIFVSHDRYFLNTIPTKIFELDNERLNIYEGNFDSYLEKKNQEIPVVTEIPTKTKNENTSYKNKKQRSDDAKRRTRLKQLETEVATSEEKISSLEAEIANPENALLYEKLNDMCNELVTEKSHHEELLSEWLDYLEE